MKTKFKSKFLSILLVLVMVLSIVPFGSLTAFAAPTLSGGKAEWNVQLSDEGVLTWNDMGSATYDIYVDKTVTGGTVTQIQGISGTSYNLINRFIELKIENGTYYFDIKANDTDTYSGYISFRYVSPEAKLSEPQNLRWDGTVAKWDSVANATEYEVKIYSNGGYSQQTITTTETQYDWTTYAQAGRWFEVVATGDNYRNSNAAEGPKYGSYSWSAPTLFGGTAAWNVQLSDEGVLTWNDMGSATYDIYVDETAAGGTVTNIQGISGTSYNLINRFKELKIENDTYYFDIKANDTDTYSGYISFRYVSPEAKLSEPQNLRWDGTVAKWDSVANATEYEVKIYSISGYSQQTITTTETQYDWTTNATYGRWFEVVATGDNYRNSNAAESPKYSSSLLPITYTVTFDSNGGSAVIAQSIEAGQTGTKPADPTKANYAFAGWYSDSGLTQAFDFNTPISTDITLYAKWDVVITAANATVTVPVAGEHPDFNPISGDSSRYTVEFVTWYLHESPYPDLDANSVFEHGKYYSLRIRFTPNAGYQFDSNTVFTVNGEATASFGGIGAREYSATAYATTYTVTYDANGGTGSMADATGVSGEYTLLANGFTAPDGKKFKAWSVGGVDKAVGDKITVTANTTVTAIWEAVEYNVTVTGGSASVGAGAPITKATMGTTVTLTAGAAPTGQMFDKWVVNGVVVDDANSATTTFVMPAGEVTATATYKDIPVVTYTVTFDSAGGSAVTAQTIEAGQKATKPADPTKSGYDFKGWTLNGSAYDFNSAVNGDITLVATWEQQQVVPTVYTVTFDSNGGSAVTAQTIEEGQKATKPADPTKSGYDFKGWTLNGSAYDFNSAVNGDITLVATWETIPAGHTCDIKPVAKVEPSCTEGGKEAYYKCEGCGKFYEDALGVKEITDLANWGNLPKLGHTESDWKSDKDNHWKECTVAACGVIIENSRAAHADANNDGKCDTCEYNVGTTTTNPDNKPSDDVQSPQTGDNSMMWLWVALLFVSGFGVVATTVIGKKKSSAK